VQLSSWCSMRNITARPHPLSIHKNDKSISKAQHLPSINDPINISISLNQCRFVDQDSNFCATALLQFHKKKSAPVDILQYPISIIYITYIYNYIYIYQIYVRLGHDFIWIGEFLQDFRIALSALALSQPTLELRYACALPLWESLNFSCGTCCQDLFVLHGALPRGKWTINKHLNAACEWITCSSSLVPLWSKSISVTCPNSARNCFL
jgi:hypothetical protein